MQHKFNSLKSALLLGLTNFILILAVLVLVVFLSESIVGAIVKILLFATGGMWLLLVDSYVIVFVDDYSITFFYPLRPWRRNTKLRYDEIDTIKEGYRRNFIVKRNSGKEIFFTHHFFPSEVKKILEIVRQKMGLSY
ncbi:MAG: hypothetical protein F9K23_09130 [Bacteroidetes bacterium]|nr:MAG: hypothetical protein F9K23_09130 [Bacteroidota bacterium]